MNSIIIKTEEGSDLYRLTSRLTDGAGKIYVRKNEIATSYYDEKLPDLLGYDVPSFVRGKQENAFAFVESSYVQKVKDAISTAAQNNSDFEIEFQMVKSDGKLSWLRMKAALVESTEDCKTFLGVYTDINSIKQAEEEALRQQNIIQNAMARSHFFVWVYDIVNSRRIQEADSAQKMNISPVIENFPSCIIERKTCHPDDAKKYLKLHSDAARGKSPSAEVRMKTLRGGYTWYRISYTPIKDENGHIISAVGTGEDLSESKRAMQLYEDETVYRNAIEASNVTYSLRVNLNTDIIEANSVGYDFENDDDRTYSHILRSALETIPHLSNREGFKKRFSRSALIESYNSGKSKVEYDYRRRLPNQKIHWVKTVATMMKHPVTGELTAFIYTRDVQESRISASLISNAVHNDYDYLAYIDMTDGSYWIYGDSDAANVKNLTNNYAADISTFMNAFSDTAEEDIAKMNLDRVIDVLEKKESYTCFVSLGHRFPMGERQKKYTFSYLDKELGLIMLSRTDITDIYRDEQRKNQMLKDALTAAEKASAAKTEFLSRMSHEIRTPMNAIIGMSTIAAQVVDDPTQVADALGKIGISARFLLSLINDILDMSRIESGKVVIKHEKIQFEEFISSINSIFFAQCQAKGIDYDAVILGMCEEYYLGDATKLQQVIINLLSNAVKFTPAGGKIQFLIRQISITGGRAMLRFTINDTGVGISEEFIPQLFEPFTQEYSSTTSVYGGTGLGLAICKNLVQLMDGRINVRSIKNVGTEFNVEIPMDIT